MSDNFYYHAFNYLDQWCQSDKRFFETLGFESKTPLNSQARACLVEAATYYQVIRNFKKEDEGSRLGAALSALESIEVPLSVEDAVNSVDELVGKFKDKYQKDLWSAASKFLWLRFRSPVIIYDSRALRWLSKNRNCSEGCSYGEYCKVWLNSYSEYELQIKAACGSLSAIKKFTLASALSGEQVSKWVQSRWFMERVFDSFLWFNGAPLLDVGKLDWSARDEPGHTPGAKARFRGGARETQG